MFNKSSLIGNDTALPYHYYGTCSFEAGFLKGFSKRLPKLYMDVKTASNLCAEKHNNLSEKAPACKNLNMRQELLSDQAHDKTIFITI